MQTPNYIDIVLIGGGHAHAQVIKMWAMKPLPGVRLSLISPSSYTPYSGMLPGLVAGHYDFEQTHIDLGRLCQFAKVRFIQASVTGIHRENRIIHLDQQADISADIISINTGIVPSHSIKGAAKFATGVKPIAGFYQQWQQLLQALKNNEKKSSKRVTVVGAGIAGVELSLAMAHKLKHLKLDADIQLAFSQSHILPGLHDKVRTRCEQALASAGIQLIKQFSAQEFTATEIVSENGAIASDIHILCTQASPAQWPEESGIDCDEQGFIKLNDHLQSINTPWLFAAGDTAQQIHHPRPQAGVFAVRQGPVLFKNLVRYALGKKLKSHKPQKEFLKIIALGGKQAVACRANKSLSGRLVWHWKNRIDKKFMAMFSQLKLSNMNNTVKKVNPKISGLSKKAMQQQAMRCGGCGAKVGGSILANSLSQLNIKNKPSVLMGTNSHEDAAAIDLNRLEQPVLLQSVDHFKGLVSNPYQQGQLAALHAISDIYAMGGQPHSALAMVSLAHAGDNITERDLSLLMQGANHVLAAHNCQLIGGHSSEGEELSLGFCINGLVDKQHLFCKDQLRSGDHLILTKPLGSGVLFAAHSQLKAKSLWLDTALESMLQSSQEAAQLARRFQASACTDITGFGLAGHLQEMINGSQQGIEIRLDDIPFYPGAEDCAKQSIRSSLYPQNKKLAKIKTSKNSPQNRLDLLFDPQTCGGLLIAVAEDQVQGLLSALRSAGYKQARDIASVNDNGGLSAY